MLMSRKRTTNPWKDLILGLILLATIPAGLAIGTILSADWLMSSLMAVVCLLGGIGVGLINIQSGTLLQTLSPAAVLGRMSGLYQSTAVTGQLLGILITPLLVPGILSMGVFFMAGATIILLISIFTLTSLHGKIQAIEVTI